MRKTVQISLLVLSFLATASFVGTALAPQLRASGTPTVTYTYDSLGRVVGEGYANYTGANTLTYTYDNAGNRTQYKVQ